MGVHIYTVVCFFCGAFCYADGNADASEAGGGAPGAEPWHQSLFEQGSASPWGGENTVVFFISFIIFLQNIDVFEKSRHSEKNFLFFHEFRIGPFLQKHTIFFKIH